MAFLPIYVQYWKKPFKYYACRMVNLFRFSLLPRDLVRLTFFHHCPLCLPRRPALPSRFAHTHTSEDPRYIFNDPSYGITDEDDSITLPYDDSDASFQDQDSRKQQLDLLSELLRSIRHEPLKDGTGRIKPVISRGLPMEFDAKFVLPLFGPSVSVSPTKMKGPRAFTSHKSSIDDVPRVQLAENPSELIGTFTDSWNTLRLLRMVDPDFVPPSPPADEDDPVVVAIRGYQIDMDQFSLCLTTLQHWLSTHPHDTQAAPLDLIKQLMDSYSALDPSMKTPEYFAHVRDYLACLSAFLDNRVPEALVPSIKNHILTGLYDISSELEWSEMEKNVFLALYLSSKRVEGSVLQHLQNGSMKLGVDAHLSVSIDSRKALMAILESNSYDQHSKDSKVREVFLSDVGHWFSMLLRDSPNQTSQIVISLAKVVLERYLELNEPKMAKDIFCKLHQHGVISIPPDVLSESNSFAESSLMSFGLPVSNEHNSSLHWLLGRTLAGLDDISALLALHPYLQLRILQPENLELVQSLRSSQTRLRFYLYMLNTANIEMDSYRTGDLEQMFCSLIKILPEEVNRLMADYATLSRSDSDMLLGQDRAVDDIVAKGKKNDVL